MAVKLINHIIVPAKIQIAYNTFKTSHFFATKDKLSDCLKSSIVYKYTCDLCEGCTYIGETVRHFQVRKNEHLSGKPVPSEVSLHQHVPKNSNFSIVCQTKHTKIGEAIIYNKIPPGKRMNNNRPPFLLKIIDQI